MQNSPNGNYYLEIRFLHRTITHLLVSFFYLVLLLSATANAAPGTITYNSNKTLNFGSVTKQTGVDVSSTVAATSSNRGEITLKDGNNNTETINITMQSCGLTQDKVKITNFTVIYGNQNWTITGEGPFTMSNLSNPANNGTKLQYGGTIIVTKDAKLGSLTPCFNITVQYDCATSTPPCTNNQSLVVNDIANVLVLGAPIEISETQNMNFGPITKPTTNSIIIMQPSGSMNVASGNAVLLNGNIGSFAEFNVITEKNVPITIYAVPGSAVRGLRLNNISAAINNDAVQNINNSGNAKTFSSTASGSNNIKLGATLEMTASNVKFGHYSLNYDVRIDYQ